MKKTDLESLINEIEKLFDGSQKFSSGKFKSLMRELDNRLKFLGELAYQNNQLLGFLAKTLAPAGASLENLEAPLSEELLEELCKLHAENSIWGET